MAFVMLLATDGDNGFDALEMISAGHGHPMEGVAIKNRRHNNVGRIAALTSALSGASLRASAGALC